MVKSGYLLYVKPAVKIKVNTNGDSNIMFGRVEFSYQPNLIGLIYILTLNLTCSSERGFFVAY